MISNPYGAHVNAWTPEAKKTLSKQRNGRILKVLQLDRGALEEWRTNNPDGLIIFRKYFPDNNIDDVDGRARAIIEDVTPYSDLVNVVETGLNETREGINDGIRDLAHAEIGIANKIRQALPRMKVGGGCFSVGTPYADITKGQTQDIEAYASAFGHLDYWMPHEYKNPAEPAGFDTINGRKYGATVLRYRWVVDWARDNNVPLPPIILGEFGYDGGGAGKGFRSFGMSVSGYMEYARNMAPLFMRDIQDGILAGVVFFCVGQDDPKSWQSFDLAGESAFERLLSEQFGDKSAQVDSSAGSEGNVLKTAPVAPLGSPRNPNPWQDEFYPSHRPAAQEAKPVTLWDEWWNTPGNEWHDKTSRLQAEAFIEHAYAAGGVKKFNPSILKDLGTPEWFWAPWNEGLKQFLPNVDKGGNYIPLQERETDADIAPQPNKLEIMERMTARRLGVPLCRVQAVYRVESNGQPFSQAGRATIRFEVHQWLKRVPSDKLPWAQANFRVISGVEQVNSGSAWENVQDKDQAGRWADLILAVQISDDLAFQWTSMGLFQILGEHYAQLHYSSAREMLQVFSHNEGAQWRGFEDFVFNDYAMHMAMIDGDAGRFAELYNGKREPYRTLLVEEGWK